EGEVSVTTRTVGDWFVVADTLPPTIRTTYKRIGADFSRASRMTFKVADNFSGIASWRMTIDGEWVPCDRYPSQGTLVHHFDRERDGRRHRITLTVTDSAGNTTRWEGEIIR
ncbi:MAG: M23 family peptidase, partial [Alistipes sp.]|nr:M23 family peptidase [Alistipes sp.]